MPSATPLPNRIFATDAYSVGEWFLPSELGLLTTCCTLQQVTDAGNITSDQVYVTNGSTFVVLLDPSAGITVEDSSGYFGLFGSQNIGFHNPGSTYSTQVAYDSVISSYSGTGGGGALFKYNQISVNDALGTVNQISVTPTAIQYSQGVSNILKLIVPTLSGGTITQSFQDATGTIALLSDIPSYSTPTLQQVTDTGNTTTDNVIFDYTGTGNSFTIQDTATLQNTVITPGSVTNTGGSITTTMGTHAFNVTDGTNSIAVGYNLGVFKIGFLNNGFLDSIVASAWTAAHTQTLPDKSGTFAMLSDIPSIVPYTGTSPIVVTGTVISINQSTTSTNGYLSSTDWNTFNNKVTSVSGTTNRITSTGGTTPVIDIASTYVGQSSITTLGTVTTGTWQGMPVADGYIASSAYWNSKMNGLVPTTVKTGAYTAVAQEYVPCDTTSASFTVTLPTTPADKTTMGVKMVVQGGTNTVTVNTGGSDVFNKAGGASSLTLSLLAQGVLLQYKASAGIWYILADDLTLAQLDLRYAPISTVGSVTSVGLSLPSIFTVSGSPVTTSGTLTGTLATQTANKIFAGPSSGSAATPTFRTLVSADIPSLTNAQVGLTGLSATGTPSSTTYLRGDNTWATVTSGGVTSVATDSTLTGGPITTTGTLGINLATANTWTGTITEQKNGIAAVSTDGIIISNTTAATSLVKFQQSPNVHFIGQGWNTSLATSQQTDFLINAVPSYSSGSGVVNSINFQSQIAGGGYATPMNIIQSSSTSYVAIPTLWVNTINGASNSSTANYLTIQGTPTNAGGIYYTILSKPASTYTNTTNSVYGLAFGPTYNQASGSGANYDFIVARTETAINTGVQRLATFGIQSGATYTEKFGVDNKGKINQVTGGTNSPIGTATLSSGTVTITNSLVTANSTIWVQYQSGQSLSLGAGLLSTLRVSSQTAGTGFTIVGDTSAGVTNTTDNSPVQWWIVN